MKKILKALKYILFAILGLVALFFLFVLYLTVREYRPEAEESLTVSKTSGESATVLTPGEEISILTWNVGYGSLGDNADFFMDGGSSVVTATKERNAENLKEITEALSALDPDIILMQETDEDSGRSYHVNEPALFSDALPGYEYTYAYNFKVDFVPYPVPPIGKVTSGLLTMSRFGITQAERISLPCPFKWPVRVANLKRCLSVNRIPVDDSGKELVIVNLHLEAYDSGEGKIAQTKMLAEFLKAEADKGNYVIAGGDFNQSFSGTDTSAYPEYEGMWHCGLLDEAAFDPSFTFCQDNTYPTCRSLDRPIVENPEHFQYYVIDGFIVSEGIEIISLETLDYGFKNTDHNPVLMKFKIAD